MSTLAEAIPGLYRGGVQAPGSLERIILVPRNGLGNRLQAWASAAHLAQRWNVPLDVMWEPEVAAPAPVTELFVDTPHWPGGQHTFIERSTLDALLGEAHELRPRYLHMQPEIGVISLAGHDRGEQVFLVELVHTIERDRRLTTLVIIAGGLFTFWDDDFIPHRRNFYRSLHWHPAITAKVAAVSPDSPYCGLHIRLTDRSLQAPITRDVTRALTKLRNHHSPQSLFIAADTAEARETWLHETRKLGFEPWCVPEVDLSRTEVSGGISAAVDWLLLSRTQSLVFPAASTFSAEACVANGGEGIALSASRVTQLMRSSRLWAAAAMTYPRRHWFTSD